jgi:dihydrofolate reductase
MNLTLDGFMSGPNGELDFHFDYWNEDMADYAARQLSKSDTILLGRVTYQAMAEYWPYQELNMCIPRGSVAYANMMNNYRKIVFSRTLEKAHWRNAVLAGNPLRKEVQELKRAPGKDMIVYGSCSVVHALMQQDLVDEYELWVHPVLLGQGKPLFRKRQVQTLELFNTRAFGSGVVVLSYRLRNK